MPKLLHNVVTGNDTDIQNSERKRLSGSKFSNIWTIIMILKLQYNYTPTFLLYPRSSQISLQWHPNIPICGRMCSTILQIWNQPSFWRNQALLLYCSSAEYTEGHPVCAPTPVQVQVHCIGRDWEDCMCGHFQLTRHVRSHTPSLEGQTM